MANGSLTELVQGTEVENDGGVCFLSTSVYPLDNLRGAYSLGSLLDQHPATFASLYPHFGLSAETDYPRAAFIDTETTGLGTGAGVYCFMVGVGTFESAIPDSAKKLSNNVPPDSVAPVEQTGADNDAGYFVVRQLFMRTPGEEAALLVALSELLEERGMTVTFNGRSFDLPLLRARYRQNRHFLPASSRRLPLLEAHAPHLDLLHPSRRLWRRRLQSCRLINLEQMILGLQRSEDDVPGHLIPQIYTDYVRSGQAGEISRVFYHNVEDIVSMVALAERLNRAFEHNRDGLDNDHDLRGADWISVGETFEQLGQLKEAEYAYRQATELPLATSEYDVAFERLGRLLKRAGRWQEAADVWQRWLTTVPGNNLVPYLELAKYCEWQTRDLEQAEMWTAWALHNTLTTPANPAPSDQLAELEHRLDRIRRKRSGQPTQDAEQGPA